jgi:Reverse transcriptase (RNA-dependent DNA polymerase)
VKIENEEDEEIIEEAPLRRSTRVSQPPTKMRDYITYKVRYPIENFISYENITKEYKAYLASIKNNESKSFGEAISQPVWYKAMREELDALEKNETWEIINLPNGKKIVGCKWAYKIKYKNDGSIDRHKVRLVPKGYTQTYDIDYQETFAPVAKMNTIRFYFP